MRASLLLTTFALSQLSHAAINWDIYEYGVVPTFQWSRPFPDDGSDPGGFHINCRHSAAFQAKLYKLKDLPDAPPAGLAPWHSAIEHFLRQREYVGSWDGVDHKGEDREVVVMEWVDVPVTVREWIEEQQRDERPTNEARWLFAVFQKPQGDGDKVYGTVRPQPQVTAEPVAAGQEQEQERGDKQGEAEKVPEVADKDKIVVFPAGAIYEIMPLWVSKGSGCERDFNNLARYKAQAVDHSVLAWPVDHTKPNRDLGKRDITFTIDAMSVTETEEGKRARLMWEKMHRTVKRNERRHQREEREKTKKEMQGGYQARDEL
ncbi:hypothetical protein C8A00DRAFT_42788 [Chaetomidium leptoderma]|uniref:Uncharacterized protein n=1 Tax=Chaetomidium leptoderma TaxID=669021 RepID=A0AAN6VNI8_9PEZI|nr:hypothetical protein C8A00DRAFT_42788 [Chaetomidium leptoderma]